MIDIYLNSGRKLTISAFSMGFTYSGLICGNATERINQSIFEKADYPINWGNRKVLKLKPSDVSFKSVLDPCYYSVWLYSEALNESDADGSLLVVTWFGDIPNGKPIEQIIEKGVKSINWELHAENYNI